MGRKGDRVVPLGRPSVGDDVWWQHTYYLHGLPAMYWRCGKVEIVRKGQRVVFVRDRYGHEVRVGMGGLFRRKPT